MAQEKIYPKGITTFKPNDKAPDFVLGTLIITLSDFRDWINDEGKQYLTKYNEKDQIRFTILKGKDGRPNIQVDTYKPNSQSENAF